MNLAFKSINESSRLLSLMCVGLTQLIKELKTKDIIMLRKRECVLSDSLELEHQFFPALGLELKHQFFLGFQHASYRT